MSRYQRHNGEPWPVYVARAARARPWGCGQCHRITADEAVAAYFHFIRSGADPDEAARLALESVGAIYVGEPLC
jgi:hypothetical protein